MNDPDLQPLGDADDLADWEVVDGRPLLNLSAVVCTRFDPCDAALLRQAARKHHMTQSEFVRWAVMRAADEVLGTRGTPTAPPVRGVRVRRQKR